MKRIALSLLAAAGVAHASSHPELGEKYVAAPGIGRELIGTNAEPWSFDNWMNSEPLTLRGLRGKVVLVRWWTARRAENVFAS
ncbi:MAG: hypothetical protein ABI680_10225 [Chthoniobacteraceae bacterium]